MLGFGLDLAGYTTGKSCLAVVESIGRNARATLLRNSVFSTKHKSSTSLDAVLRQEAEALRRCFTLGTVAVDIPIDLQGLPNPKSAQRVWELTLRPVDKLFGAMPTFADRIGAPVARFQAILRAGEFNDRLGARLFETYPAATWRVCGATPLKYKAKNGSAACRKLCEYLTIQPPLDNDDDIDAVICAVTAAATPEYLCGKEQYGICFDQLPRGYRIVRTMPFESIVICEADFDQWMSAHEVLA